MIDYTVCHIRNPELATSLIENKMLDFGLKRSEQTGDIFNNGRQDGKLLNLFLEIWPSGFIRISGSLHTFYNALHEIINKDGYPMNHDTFNWAKLSYVIEYLKAQFGINPMDVTIHQIEFGVNLNLNIPTKNIIDSFIAYKKYPFEHMKNIKGVGYGRESCLKQYRIKLYDKALQNGLANGIFRLEYKAYKMQPLFGKRNIRLIDLLEMDIWEGSRRTLFKTLDDCVITDEIDMSSLTIAEQKLIEECRNPRNWEAFNTKERTYRKKRFNALMGQHGKLQIKQKIRDYIENEITNMFSVAK